MALSREMQRDINRHLLPRLMFPLVMVLAGLVGVYKEQAESAEKQLEISLQIERDTVRSELSDIDHRIVQEDCVVRPIRQVIRQRVNERTDTTVDVCDPDEALPDLMARRDQLDARLREMGAYEVRNE